MAARLRTVGSALGCAVVLAWAGACDSPIFASDPASGGSASTAPFGGGGAAGSSASSGGGGASSTPAGGGGSSSADTGGGGGGGTGGVAGGGGSGGTGGHVCVPTTCAGFDCGTRSDGCGGVLQCGECPAGKSCGHGGQPNVCGAFTCSTGHLVINEFRTRGLGGGTDEFVELYNPTATDVVLDATWNLQGAAFSTGNYIVRWTGSGGTIPAGGYFLLQGSGYTQVPTSDSVESGFGDAISMVLFQGAAVVDAVCFYFGAPPDLSSGAFHCEGTPVVNPHSDASTNTNVSLQRNGLAGCPDTDDNASDFSVLMPSTPTNAAGEHP